MNNEQLGCRHRYVETEKNKHGYYFKCVHCGKQIFGSIGK